MTLVWTVDLYSALPTIPSAAAVQTHPLEREMWGSGTSLTMGQLLELRVNMAVSTGTEDPVWCIYIVGTMP